jgi:glycerophosphoryl diester phosphodiesterase
MHPLLDFDSHPVIGHRGASGLAPENTLAAFALAVEQGADGIEFDIRLSRDGVPMVFHDPTLERTTNGSGPLRAHSAAELYRLDAGHRFGGDGGSLPWRGRGAGIPRLAEVLEQFPATPLLIELKEVEAAGPVLELLQRHETAPRTLVASFLDGALDAFRASGFRTCASRRGIAQLAVRSLFGLGAPHLQDHAYAVPERYKDRIPVPTARFIGAARRAGCPVHVWTVNDPAHAVALWRRGAAGMISNFPALILAERQRVFPALTGSREPGR